MIFVNSIALSNLDFREQNKNSTKNKVINYIDAFFTLIFIFEALLKIIASGLVLQKHSYLRYYLNYLDLMIIVSG